MSVELSGCRLVSAEVRILALQCVNIPVGGGLEAAEVRFHRIQVGGRGVALGFKLAGRHIVGCAERVHLRCQCGNIGGVGRESNFVPIRPF